MGIWPGAQQTTARRRALQGGQCARAPRADAPARPRPRPCARADGASASSVNRVHRSGDSRLLVTSDDASHLKLFNFPCIVEDAPFSGPHFAHASHVPAAIFLRGDSHVASAGGSDRTVMLWRVVPAEHALGDSAAGGRVVGTQHPRPNDLPPPNRWRPTAYGKPHSTNNLYA